MDFMDCNMNFQWLAVLKDLLNSSLIVSPRGNKIKELLNYHTCVDMKYPILSIKERKLGYKFMTREAWWIMDGRNSVETITNYSKAISSFSNDGFHFDGAYGPRVVDQIRYIVDSFEFDIDTRQAVLTIWRSNPRASKDIPCTVAIQWLIRNNKIHCIDTMRSSDIWLGWPYDIFNFSMLTCYILLLLKQRGINNIELGNIYLNAGSQHLYENNWEKAQNLINNYTIMPYKPLNPNEFDNPMEFKHYLKALSEGDYETLNKSKSNFGRDILCV